MLAIIVQEAQQAWQMHAVKFLLPQAVKFTQNLNELQHGVHTLMLLLLILSSGQS